MKTALDELLDYLHADEMHEEMNENLQVHNIVYKVAELLKLEKKQIIRAYEAGNDSHPYPSDYNNGKEYFNQTYILNS